MSRSALARITRTSLPAALLLGAAVIVAACANKAESPEATPVPTPATTARTTGIAAVDAIIAATTRGDTAALRDAIEFMPIACIKTPEGIGAPPICRDNEAEGTLVHVIPLAQCEGFFSRPDELTLDALAGGATLYAVYRPNSPDQFPPGGKYWAIFAPNDVTQATAFAVTAFALVTNDDHIVGIHFGCAGEPAQLVEFQGLTDVVVPPIP